MNDVIFYNKELSIYKLIACTELDSGSFQHHSSSLYNQLFDTTNSPLIRFLSTLNFGLAIGASQQDQEDAATVSNGNNPSDPYLKGSVFLLLGTQSLLILIYGVKGLRKVYTLGRDQLSRYQKRCVQSYQTSILLGGTMALANVFLLVGTEYSNATTIKDWATLTAQSSVGFWAMNTVCDECKAITNLISGKNRKALRTLKLLQGTAYCATQAFVVKRVLVKPLSNQDGSNSDLFYYGCLGLISLALLLLYSSLNKYWGTSQ